MLVAGGFGIIQSRLNSAELYDPMTGLWTLTGSMHVARGSHRATLLSHGRVLVTAGDTIGHLRVTETYDSVRGVWQSSGNLLSSRHFSTATRLENGMVLVAGGDDGATAELGP